MGLACFAACGGNSSTSETDGEKTLIIGCSGPLTGNYATYGISVKNGAQIAVDEINEAGGINGYKFELKMEDDQTNTEAAVNAYNALMDAGMNVCLGAVTSGACIALNEEAKKDGILSITPSGSQVECVQYDNAFRVCFNDPAQGTYSADFISNKSLASKVAIIYDKSNDYSVGIHDTFVSEAANKNIEIVTDQAFTNQSNTDFSAQLQAVKSSGAELLFLPIYAQEAAYILTQANSMGLKNIIFFGVDGMDGILEKIGEDNLALTEGVMLLTPFSASSTDEKVQNFVKKYKDAHGMTPDQFAADGYDAVYAIAAALEKSGANTDDSDFNEKMIAAMTEIELDGVTGHMTWAASGEPTKEAQAVIIKDGAYELYE